MPNDVFIPGVSFPFLSNCDRERRHHPEWPVSVPWKLIEPHAAQASKNHGGQTLQRLAERGGLSIHEMYAVLTDRDFHQVSALDTVAVMDEILRLGKLK